jgi:hypothetical protein
MDIFVRFIGLILIYQASAGQPYRAIIPKWDMGETFCTHTIMEHAGYVRIENGHVIAADTTWPKDKDCDPGQPCELYRILDGTTLKIDGGFTPVTGLTPATLPCFAPHIEKEGLVRTPSLHPDALTTRSVADFTISSGEVWVHQFEFKGMGVRGNDSIFTALKIKAPPGTPAQSVKVIAEPRGGGTPLVLTVRQNTIIDIVNLPVLHAGEDYETQAHVNDPALEGHFFFIHKLLSGVVEPRDCNDVPARAPVTCMPRLRDHVNSGVTHNLGCGSSGCC